MAVGLLSTAGATTAAGFEQPDVIASHNGVLRTTLVAQEGEAMMGGKKVSRTMTYNGKFPGPTLRVHPGDRIEIKLVNAMSEETNFHFHGLHVSPAGKADNVLRIFKPGSTNRISVKVPHDHPNGLYWYHPHRHGDVNSQVLRGLAGMISIEGGKERIDKLASFKQRLIALNLTQLGPDGKSVIPSADQNDPTSTTTVNGKLGQVIQMHPGQTEMWRIANMSNEGFYKLNLEGHKMWIVGQDGNPTRIARPVHELVIPPGSRYEVLVKAGKRGQYRFRELLHSDGFNMFPAQDLLTLKVGGRTATSPPVPRKIRKFEDLSRKKVDVRRTWVLSFGQNAQGFAAEINGKVFSPDRVDTRARIDSVEEWTFINQTSQDHPMHLHTNDFQIVKINGKPFHANGTLDNAILPRNGSLTIRFRPKTYTGLAVFHCHILFHEDSGMMATIRYVKGGRSVHVRPGRHNLRARRGGDRGRGVLARSARDTDHGWGLTRPRRPRLGPLGDAGPRTAPRRAARLAAAQLPLALPARGRQ